MTHRPGFPRRASLALGATALGAWSAGHSVHAQTTTAPGSMRLIVSAQAGTAPDLAARLLAGGLSRLRGHLIVIDNRPGADGVLAAEAFSQARPGDALFFSFAGVKTVVPLMMDRVPYDADADLVPLHAFATDFLGLCVSPALPVRNVLELTDYVRGRPGTINWFSAPGPGYLTFRNFMRASGGLDMTFVSYRGAPPALLDLASDRIQVALSPLASVLPLLREGRVKMLLVTNRTRATALPDMPTATEAGAPSLDLEGIMSLFGWRDMPEAARQEMAAQAQHVLADPAVVQGLRAAGMEPRGSASPAAFADELAEHRSRWARLARDFGARPPG